MSRRALRCDERRQTGPRMRRRRERRLPGHKENVVVPRQCLRATCLPHKCTPDPPQYTHYTHSITSCPVRSSISRPERSGGELSEEERGNVAGQTAAADEGHPASRLQRDIAALDVTPEAPVSVALPSAAATWTVTDKFKSPDGIGVSRNNVFFSQLHNGHHTLPCVRKVARSRKERIEAAYLYLLTRAHGARTRPTDAPLPTPSDQVAYRKGVVPQTVRPAIEDALIRGEYRRAQNLYCLGGPIYSLFVASGEGQAMQPGQEAASEVAVVEDLHSEEDAKRCPHGSFLALKVLLFPPGDASVLPVLGKKADEAGLGLGSVCHQAIRI
ncbi:unnamed protein product [Vitrella brassicaformis CCMP3155]|uniref:Uncharacterized protein n=1 Tax=Vitrella brassicaformis (strain CCMP3155) TaxID=1169540 RepID=A0A0G4GQH3_VITBC|nr:unnamed protein product [Vitrella brassicaformis CCMP3155]|eukprot:CEM32692.1 unnamed protein product [Vitrella brassicaformis CCMP3155]